MVADEEGERECVGWEYAASRLPSVLAFLNDTKEEDDAMEWIRDRLRYHARHSRTA